MTKSGQSQEAETSVSWDGMAEPVRGKSGGRLSVVMVRKPISKKAAESQAATLKQAAQSGAPLCEP